MANLTDCFFYFKGNCAKEDQCEYRHEPSALGSTVVCSWFLQGKCMKRTCNRRHAAMKNVKDYISLRRHPDEDLLSASRGQRVRSADEVINIRKEPIAVDLEIHHESPDHRQIRQAPVNDLNRTVSLPKNELDLYYSVCEDDVLHIKSLSEIRREQDVKEVINNEKQKHWNRLADISDDDIMEYRQTKTTISRQRSVPTRRLISPGVVEASLDFSTMPLMVAVNPLSTSTPESRQTLAANLNFAVNRPQYSPSFTNQPTGVHGQQQAQPITYNSFQQENEQFAFNHAQLQNEAAASNNIIQPQEVALSPPPLEEIYDSDLEILPMTGVGISVNNAGSALSVNNAGNALSVNNACSETANNTSAKRKNQPRGDRQLRRDAREKIQANRLLKTSAGANNQSNSSVCVNGHVKVEGFQSGVRLPIANGSHRKTPTTMSITQKRAMSSRYSAESGPPTKVVSGPPSPTHYQVNAGDFWRAHARNRSEPNLLRPANISLLRLSRLSDNLTGLERSSAPSSPTALSYRRPVVVDILNVSQEELDMTASYYRLVKPEPDMPELEATTPPDSDSEWDDEFGDSQDVLDIHADGSISDSDFLLDRADELTR